MINKMNRKIKRLIAFFEECSKYKQNHGFIPLFVFDFFIGNAK